VGKLADSDPPALYDTPLVPSSAHLGYSGFSSVRRSHEKYDRLRQLEFSQNSHSATHASSSGMHTYNASP